MLQVLGLRHGLSGAWSDSKLASEHKGCTNKPNRESRQRSRNQKASLSQPEAGYPAMPDRSLKRVAKLEGLASEAARRGAHGSMERMPTQCSVARIVVISSMTLSTKARKASREGKGW